MENETIKMCYRCGKTPLLWTFKFVGAEYWCPSCGYTSGMFGAGQDVPATEELKQLKQDWKEKALPYLKGETDIWEYEAENL